jgi:hypothetical protein
MLREEPPRHVADEPHVGQGNLRLYTLLEGRQRRDFALQPRGDQRVVEALIRHGILSDEILSTPAEPRAQCPTLGRSASCWSRKRTCQARCRRSRLVLSCFCLAYATDAGDLRLDVPNNEARTAAPDHSALRNLERSLSLKEPSALRWAEASGCRRRRGCHIEAQPAGGCRRADLSPGARDGAD